MSGFEALALDGGQGGVAEAVLDRPEQQRQRRAELVADVRKKRRFRAVEFGEGVGAPPLLLIGARIGDRIADLPRQQVEKCLVVPVQTLMGVETGDEDRRGLVPGGKNDRDQARSGGRHRPAPRGGRGTACPNPRR